MKKRISMWALKLIGVLLFVWIVANIDARALITEITQADTGMLALSFPLVFLIYFFRTQRWKELVHVGGIAMPFKKHWEIMNVGIFLACILPGKVGEMGKAAYLKAKGMRMATAVIITILDRAIDTAFVGLIAAVGAGLLFGWQWTLVAAAGILIAVMVAFLFRDRLKSAATYLPPRLILPVIIWTGFAWTIHFVWAIMLARAVGIDTAIPVLIAVLTFTGMLSLLPIAPSGLGTRDAALILLLAPYGVPAEQAVALAFLMFVSIILSGLLGGYYFMRGKV